MPTYDYLCSCGEVTEARAGYGEDSPIRCRACGLPAVRQSVYLIIPVTENGVKLGRLNPVPRDEKRVPLSKFQEAAAELDYAHQKAENEAQRELPSRDYYHDGLRQADLVRAGLRPPPKEF